MPTSVPDWKFDPESESARLAQLALALSQADSEVDRSGEWSEPLWSLLVEAGATRWALPAGLGGESGDRSSLVRRYAKVAEGSLTAAFILTQHDAAIRRLVAASTPNALRYLMEIAEGARFPTVGISQLTTSRRRGGRAMEAHET